MKILAVGRNYINHAKELNNEVPKEPVLFMMPETALLQKNKDFYYPDFSQEIHYEVELVVRINRLGKHISEQFAYRYYDEIGIGIDFTARDLQKELKSKGLPWERAKAFDGSAPLGQFVNKNDLPDVNNISFSLQKNDTIVQQGNSKDMIFSIDKIIAYASQFFTLKIGDLIYTGTPAGVGAIQRGDVLRASIENKELLSVKIK